MEVEFRTRRIARALLSTLTSSLIHIASLTVFGFFDLVDQVLCPVFSYLDWALDRREISCYCHEELSNFEADNNKLALSGSGAVTDCEFWEGQSSTLYGRRQKHGSSRVHFLTLHRCLSVDAIQPLKSRCVDLISGRNLWRVCDSISPDKGLVLNVEKSYSTDTGDSSCQLSRGRSVFQNNSPGTSSPKSRWSDCGCCTCTAWHTSEDLFVRLGGRG